ncbi:ABC transporter permease [Mogibacterium sp. NSJ-24]|uniref:ABC transporter permease n=1 Tax=Lentihominibacter hominis TaxID=2763645 RepID=A0A926E8L1_9FIRM|nr:ABC transporter permease [Lentihominibacter hominis]MBC8568390.1 ABC transporter permease [Lentihominibacter hominis]
MRNNLWNIFRKEVRELFRDKKSLSMMLIIPVSIPLIILGMSALFESQANKDVTEYNRIGFAYEMSQAEKSIAETMDIDVVKGTEKELEKKFADGDIDLYVARDGKSYIINGDSSDTSTYSAKLMESYYNTYKEYLQQDFLRENNIDADQMMNIITVEERFADEDNFFAGYIKNYAFLFIIMAITVSATYPSTDTTAGERERGTLETLLTFPIKSRDIIIGKFLGVTISAIVTGVISLILSIISLAAAKNIFSIYKGVDTMYSPVSIVFAVIVIVAFSFFISGLCIAIASKSKTFKEAQSALTPLTFISLFPGMIAFMIGVTGTPLISIIPFLNYVVLFTDINNGDISLLNITLMFVSTIVYISIVLVYIIKQYKSEKVLLVK